MWQPGKASCPHLGAFLETSQTEEPLWGIVFCLKWGAEKPGISEVRDPSMWMVLSISQFQRVLNSECVECVEPEHLQTRAPWWFSKLNAQEMQENCQKARPKQGKEATEFCHNDKFLLHFPKHHCGRTFLTRYPPKI